jgi:hypothetical protein
MTTVCQGIADEYTKSSGVPCRVQVKFFFYERLGPADRMDGGSASARLR